MLKKFFKYTFFFILFFIIISVGFYVYSSHQESVQKAAELKSYTKQEWAWENEYSKVQIRRVESMNKSVLRKVHLNENYVVYAYMNDDYTYSTLVAFQTKCKPGTIITTTEKFSNGEPKTLNCDSDGESLIYEVVWPAEPMITSWSENLNGYSVDETFYSWNFDKLKREVTLNKAK